MTGNRYDALPGGARWLMENFDELTIAEMCAGRGDQVDRLAADVQRVRDALSSFDGRGVMTRWGVDFNVPTAGEVINAVSAALDGPAVLGPPADMSLRSHHADCDRCEITDPCPCCGIRFANGRWVAPAEVTTEPCDPQTDTEPDNPAAWALARHIADHSLSTIQAAFRYLNTPLTIELHDDGLPTPAGDPPDDECRRCGRDTAACVCIDTTGCDCGHDGLQASWHRDDCAWIVTWRAAIRHRILQLAAAVAGLAPDMDPGRWQAILAGQRRATSTDLALIAQAAGVTVDWLLAGIRPRTANGAPWDSLTDHPTPSNTAES